MKFSKPFLAAVLFVLGMAVYATSFGNAMFWDDDDFILKNQYIQDTKYLPKLFSENVIAGSGLVSDYWRPVLLLVFSAEWHAWGNWVVGWHAVNALFHVANGLLLFWFLLRILSVIARSESASDVAISSSNSLGLLRRLQGQSPRNDRDTNEVATSQTPRNDRVGSGIATGYLAMTDVGAWIAFFVALIFLIHPVQVEAVAYVNSLGDSLSTCFMFTALLLYARYLERRNGWAYVGAVALYPLALMSKETAIILPGLLLLTDVAYVLPSARLRTLRTWLWGACNRMLPFVLLGISYVAARVTFLNFKNSLNLYNHATAYTESVWVRLLTFCKVLWEYAQLIVWPQTLHMERSMQSATTLFDVSVLAGIGIVLLLAGIAVWAWRRGNRIPLFGVLWFLIALAPTSNIAVPINGVLYEHWLYVPLAGVVLTLVSVLADLLRKYKSYKSYRSYRTYSIAGVVFLLAFALMARSVLRIREWGDPVAFYSQTAQYAPDSYRIVNNLAMELADRGDLRESVPHYQKAIALDPQNPVAYYNLGNTYAALGQYADAASYYEQALTVDEAFLYAYRPLMNLYLQAKKYTRVRELLGLYLRVHGVLEPDLQNLQTTLNNEAL